MPKVAKTNIGTKIFQQQEHISQGSPNLSSKKVIFGNIRDIIFPQDTNGRLPPPKKRKNLPSATVVLVQIDFEGRPKDDFWYTLNEDPQALINTLGNKETFKATRPRIMFTFHPANFNSGIATIACDNTKDSLMKDYQSNRSNNIVGIFSGLTSNTRPPGY